MRVVNTMALDLGKDRAATVQRVVQEGKRAIAEDGADTLTLGCMSMGFLEIAEEVSQVLGVRVINPSRFSLKAAEALVGAGLRHSKQAFMTPPKIAEGQVKRAADLIVPYA